jgi:hypothetical protein
MLSNQATGNPSTLQIATRVQQWQNLVLISAAHEDSAAGRCSSRSTAFPKLCGANNFHYGLGDIPDELIYDALSMCSVLGTGGGQHQLTRASPSSNQQFGGLCFANQEFQGIKPRSDQISSQIHAVPPPPPQPPTVVRFSGPISVERPSPCPTCCLKCPGGVCTKSCNKQLLKEIFQKMFDANEERIKKLKFFMAENKKRISTSENRVAK